MSENTPPDGTPAITRQLVTVRGSDELYPAPAVRAAFGWLERLLVRDPTGFLAVADLACNGRPPGPDLTARLIRDRVLEHDGSIQTTYRDLARLMILHPEDVMSMRLARWEELEVRPAAS